MKQRDINFEKEDQSDLLFILEGHSTASLPDQAPSLATTPPSPCCSPYGMSATQKGRHTGGQPDRQRSRPGPNEDAKQSHAGSLFYSFVIIYLFYHLS